MMPVGDGGAIFWLSLVSIFAWWGCRGEGGAFVLAEDMNDDGKQT